MYIYSNHCFCFLAPLQMFQWIWMDILGNVGCEVPKSSPAEVLTGRLDVAYDPAWAIQGRDAFYKSYFSIYVFEQIMTDSWVLKVKFTRFSAGIWGIQSGKIVNLEKPPSPIEYSTCWFSVGGRWCLRGGLHEKLWVFCTYKHRMVYTMVCTLIFYRTLVTKSGFIIIRRD